MKRGVAVVVFDCLLLTVACAIALLLRENFEPTLARVTSLVPYLVATALAAIVVLPLVGTVQPVWRLTGLQDYLRLTFAAALVVACAVGLVFVYNRFDGIARSMPVIHFFLGSALLVSVRVLARLKHMRRASHKHLSALDEAELRSSHALLVGHNRLAEAYLHALREFSNRSVQVEGVLPLDARHSGRDFMGHAVLGTPEDISDILSGLEVHGVFIDRIVLACRLSSLSDEARTNLSAVASARGIKLDVISEVLGLEGEDNAVSSNRPTGAHGPWGEPAFSINAARLKELAGRPFWKLKRAIDIVLSLALIVLILPLQLFAALLVAIDVGFPVVFWQKRPGLGGREIKIFKLRTMAASHDRSGRRIPDSQRVSAIGSFMRKTKLDELPQLFSILKGEMSFVGPRPLLPVDQPLKYRARLLVRPGLTGWAQVQGGRVISADDKAALDVWYIENASLWLDLKVVILTAFVVIFGERPNRASIKRAWRDLRLSGIYVVAGAQTGPVLQGEPNISFEQAHHADQSRAA